jgi:hypothetical protein
MFVLLYCASPIKGIRAEIARVARDHGLTEILPFLYQGELTAYRRGLLEQEARFALRRRRPYHLEILTLPDGHFLGRVRQVRR